MEFLETVPKRICDSRRQRLDGADFEHQGFFLLRTPLLAVDELDIWSADLRAPAAADRTALENAIHADRKTQRLWLLALLSRPSVIEALHVATPALLDA